MGRQFEILRNFAPVPEILTTKVIHHRRTKYITLEDGTIGLTYETLKRYYRVTEHYRVPGLEEWTLKHQDIHIRSFETLPRQLMPVYSAVMRLYKHKYAFSAVMLNDYGEGSHIQFHNDQGVPAFCILCIGGKGLFKTRRSDDPRFEYSYVVNHGDLIYMPPGFDYTWDHAITNLERRQSVVFRGYPIADRKEKKYSGRRRKAST